MRPRDCLTPDERPDGLTICLLQIASFAKYRRWHHSTFGHRFLITTVVLSAIPIGALVDWTPAAGRRRDGAQRK